jgi:hypothetical protein
MLMTTLFACLSNHIDQGGIPTQHNHLILVPLSREHEEGTVHMYNERPTFIWIDRLKWRNLLIIAFAIHALFLLYDIVGTSKRRHDDVHALIDGTL